MRRILAGGSHLSPVIGLNRAGRSRIPIDHWENEVFHAEFKYIPLLKGMPRLLRKPILSWMKLTAS